MTLLEMRTLLLCGMEAHLDSETSHLLPKREWKRLKWLVWKQRGVTMGQGKVCSTERTLP